MRKLDRDLGLVSVISIAIGSMVGGGIFVLPGLAAMTTGPSLWLAYTLAGLLVLPAALSQSEMATALPKAGGVYVFVDRSMGPMYGTIAGIGTWLAMLFKASFALIGISVYLSMFAKNVSPKTVALFLLVGIVGLNILGVKKVGKFQVVVVAACFLSLGALIFKGVLHTNPAHMKNYFSNGPMGLLEATGLVFISYAGVTKIASIAEEIINPARNLPLAMLLSLIVMMALYSLVSFVMVGNIPMFTADGVGQLAKNERAVSLLGDVLFGTPGKLGMAVIAIIALASMANAGLLAASRYPLAMSRDEMIPSVFQHISERFVTPVVSIVFTALCMALAISFLKVVKIAKLASGMQVLLFMAINISVMLLRESKPQWYQPKFHSPLYPGVQILGILGSLVLLVMLGSFVLIGTAVLLLLGVAWFFIYARHKTLRRGVLQKIRRKPDLSPERLMEEEREEIPETDLVIPLSGDEFSPESLLGIASALGAHEISVLDLVEIPEQSSLYNPLVDETPRMQMLRRRMRMKSEWISVQTKVSFIASHDRRHALYDYVLQSKAPWVLVDMGPLKKFPPVRRYLGWLVGHMPCNLAVFRNEGFRITQNVLVVLNNTPVDRLLLDVANNLAEIHDARLKVITVAAEGATQEQIKSLEHYLDTLMERCTITHLQREVLCGDVLHEVAQESVHHELLVVRFPQHKGSQKLFFGNPHDSFEGVACSVLSIKAVDETAELSLPDRVLTRHIPDLLDPRTIRTRDHVETEEELWEHFAQLFSKVTQQPVETLQKALRERDADAENRLGERAALFHTTLDTLPKTHLGMLLLDAPIEVENTNLDIIVFTIGPHAHLYADKYLRERLQEILGDEEVLTLMRAAHNTDSIMRLIRGRHLSKPSTSDNDESASLPHKLEPPKKVKHSKEATEDSKAPEAAKADEADESTDASEGNEVSESKETDTSSENTGKGEATDASEGSKALETTERDEAAEITESSEPTDAADATETTKADKSNENNDATEDSKASKAKKPESDKDQG